MPKSVQNDSFYEKISCINRLHINGLQPRGILLAVGHLATPGDIF